MQTCIPKRHRYTLSVGAALIVVYILWYQDFFHDFFHNDFTSMLLELRGAYAWVDGDLVAVKKLNASQQELQPPPPEHFICMEYQGRLGNHLFQYAALMGIAESNNLLPVIPEDLELLDYFDLDAVKAAKIPSQSKWANSLKYSDKKSCTFEPPVMEMGNGSDVFLVGYFQSWKYFEKIRKSLQRQFTFKSHVRQKAHAQIKRLTRTRCTSSSPPCTYVGVHVRRGDMTSDKHIKAYGYVTAKADYYLRAMDHFRSQFGAKERLVFVVTSDDPRWCRRELVNLSRDDVVVTSEKNSPAEDMAILAQMNHTVISPSSFSWWSAWMAGGSVVYSGDYPRPGSELEKLFTREDYYFLSWIPL